VQKAAAIHKTKTGRVVSDKMDKTIVVQVETVRRHPIYKRAMRRNTKFLAHDEHGTARVGDLVKIEETRPLSKLKRWRVVEVLKKGVGLD
jgi:small subunit ribosomal protein S17